MAYRNGTYVAFHANGTNIPINSDIKYYNLLKAWSGKDDDSFTMINSHEKVAGVRDSSSKETLRASLKTRLANSKNILLILGETTKQDTDWVPFEIAQAADVYKIPFIIAYIGVEYVQNPTLYSQKWPAALAERIRFGSVNAIHIPFKKQLINQAISQFNLSTPPIGKGIGYYDARVYSQLGVPIP